MRHLEINGHTILGTNLTYTTTMSLASSISPPTICLDINNVFYNSDLFNILNTAFLAQETVNVVFCEARQSIISEMVIVDISIYQRTKHKITTDFVLKSELFNKV